MKKETTRYVQYFTPGTFVGESWTVDLPSGTLPVWEDKAYAYQIWTREDVIDGETRYAGDPKKEGKMVYHRNSVITSIEDVRKGDTPTPPGPALLSNMECNKWDNMIWTRWGNWPQVWDPETMEREGLS